MVLLERQIGKYEVIRHLGRSNSSVVLARDLEHNVDVALKLVELGDTRDARDLLQAEEYGAKLQAFFSRQDRRVPLVDRPFRSQHYFCIPMEYIDGEDLSELIARGPLPLPRALSIAHELLGLLENAERFTAEIDGKPVRGFIHGDFKPRNVRISSRGEVKVLDFGLAKGLTSSKDRTRQEFGSLPYASPERIEHDQVDRHSDLWSVSVVLYEMLSGQRPWPVRGDAQLERAILSPQGPQALPGSVPPVLQKVMRKALRRYQADRYLSAAELQEDLYRFEHKEPTVAEWEEGRTERVTLPGQGDEERTQRTSLPPQGGPTGRSVPPPFAVSPVLPRPRRHLGRWLGLGFFLTLFGWCLYLVVHEYNVRTRAEELTEQVQRDVRANRDKELEGAWERYEALQKESTFPSFTLWGLRRALKSRYLSTGDAILSEYREHDDPRPFKKKWEKAEGLYQHALALDSGSREILGKLRVAQGHLSAGTEAEEHFLEARSLWKKSEDPLLGLAEVYAYQLHDTQKTEEVMNALRELGHTLSRRDKAQLADAYRYRADRVSRECRGPQGAVAQERSCWQGVIRDYEQAIQYYAEIRGYGNATASLVAVLRKRDAAVEKLHAAEPDSWLRPEPTQSIRSGEGGTP